MVLLNRVIMWLCLGHVAFARQDGEIVDSVLPLLGEPGPVERSRTELINGLTIHHWTNRVLGSRGLVVCPSGGTLEIRWSDTWRVMSTNLNIAARFRRGSDLRLSSPSIADSAIPPVFYAERISADGLRTTIGEQEIGVPSYFAGRWFDPSSKHPWAGIYTSYPVCLRLIRTPDTWIADRTISSPVAGGRRIYGWDADPAIVRDYNFKEEVSLIDVDNDGSAEFVLVETLSSPGFTLSFRLETFTRILMPVEGTSIKMDPINTPSNRISVVGPDSRWSNQDLAMYRSESASSFNTGSSLWVTGSFTNSGFMGVRCTAPNGIRYGWVQWPSNSREPIRKMMGRPDQTMATGRPAGTHLWVESGEQNQTRVRWILEKAQSIERWIPGDARGWHPVDSSGSDAYIPDPRVPSALFRIRIEAVSTAPTTLQTITTTTNNGVVSTHGVVTLITNRPIATRSTNTLDWNRPSKGTGP